MTLEAVALHHLDNLDAKLHSFQQLMRDDPNVDSPWTQYHQTWGVNFSKATASRLHPPMHVNHKHRSSHANARRIGRE